MLLSAIIAAHPHVRGTLFDLQEGVDAARRPGLRLRGAAADRDRKLNLSLLPGGERAVAALGERSGTGKRQHLADGQRVRVVAACERDVLAHPQGGWKSDLLHHDADRSTRDHIER